MYLALARLGTVCVWWRFLVLVCVRTQCVPSVATRVEAQITDTFLYILEESTIYKYATARPRPD